MEHLDYKEQVELLKKRKMLFKDEIAAEKKLSNVNYYKIKEFAEPFCIKESDDLDYRGIYFEYIVGRYINDKHLRMNLFDAIENIEVSVKTNLSYILGHGSLAAYGYLEFKNWANKDEYCKYYLADKEKEFKNKIKKYLKNTDNKEIKRKMKESNKEYPPIWLLINILTFGDMIRILELLSKSKLKKLSHRYGITGEKLISWLKTLNLVRNLCAHNSNIVDLKLKTTPKIHEDWKDILYINNKGYPTNRLAIVLCVVDKLIHKIDSDYNFKSIKTSLDKVTERQLIYSQMLGFKDYHAMNLLYKNKVKSKIKNNKKRSK